MFASQAASTSPRTSTTEAEQPTERVLIGEAEDEAADGADAAQKPAAKPVAAAKAPAAPKAPKAAKPAKVEVKAEPKPKKAKLVRDSFTIPKPEYLVLDEIKQRAQTLARPVKKSEILRAAIKSLAALTNVALLAALAAVPAIKTGRPSTEEVAEQNKPVKKTRNTKR